MLGGETPMDVELERDFDDAYADSVGQETETQKSKKDEEERVISRELNRGIPAPGGTSGMGHGKGKKPRLEEPALQSQLPASSPLHDSLESTPMPKLSPSS